MVSVEYQSALLGLGTAVASSAITFLLIRLSIHLSLVAKVRSDRWHHVATPNTGGIAIVFGCVAAALCAPLPGPYSLIIAVGVALAGLGVIDDRFQLRPLTKLAGQAIAAGIVIASGVMFRLTSSDAINVAITFFWLIAITNAFNLIDNMDGLCAGVTIIIAAFRLVAAVQAGDRGAAFTMAILGGGYAGFLLFNYKPAKIFMGDGGSMFAGFVLASVTICSPAPATRPVWFALYYPALTFLYPIFDTALVCVLRRRAGRPISLGGRDHSSHRLVLLGLSEQKTAWALWGVASMGAVAGLFGGRLPIDTIAPSVLLLFGVIVFGVFLGGVPAFEMPRTAPIRSDRIRKLIPGFRIATTVAMDVVLAAVALLSALLLRRENGFSSIAERQLLYVLPSLCVCHAVACVVFRTAGCGWRCFSLADLWRIAKSAAFGCAAFAMVLWFLGERGFSGATLGFYGGLSLVFGAGIRLLMRALCSLAGPAPPRKRAGIWGAGEEGELAILICQRRGISAYPVVVLESDPAANHTTVRGVPVRSADGDPLRVLKQARADMLIVPSGLELQRADRDLLEHCRMGGVRIVRLEVSLTPIREAPIRPKASASLDSASEVAVATPA